MSVYSETLPVIQPRWSVAANIKAFTTTRTGGVSQPPWDSLNLARHVNDSPEDVSQNRRLLKQSCNLPVEPAWLEQVHSDTIIRLTEENSGQHFKADASYTTIKNTICCVMTADCLPVLFCNKQASWVAAAHAGWKGIANGILKKVVGAYCQTTGGEPTDLLVWIGPAISGSAYQVGEDVRHALVQQDSILEQAFSNDKAQHYLLNSALAAQLQLVAQGLQQTQITNADCCTYRDKEHFFSYRRDGVNSGRMASLIWLS